MKLKVFTTARQVRNFLENQKDGVVDKAMPIGEFFNRAIVVEKKRFVDEELRKVFLYEAMQSVDVQKLGLPKDFLKFFKSADFVLDFFGELAKEEVMISELMLEDIYAEYEEHLTILQELLREYKAILERNGFVDGKILKDFTINTNFFKQFDSIEIEVAGYLSRFERKILESIDLPIELKFWVSRYNRPLIKKMFGKEFEEGIYRYALQSEKIVEHEPLPMGTLIETASFSDRIHQVSYVLASIQELYERGCEPSKMAVIVPDESFSEYLELFDNGNLNFAMGMPFVHSDLYQLLDAIYRSEEDEVARKVAAEYLEEFEKSDLLEFIKNHANSRELAVIDEELYRLSKILPYIEKERHLHFVLDRFRRLAFDDVKGGKVTVMGVLEARGMEFDGVIVVDFNEGIVPNVGSSDMFLNSVVRKRAGLPTRNDKEALQKHYYHQLLHSAKFVRLAYVENEEQMPSRFLYELGVQEGKKSDVIYDEVLFRFGDDPTPPDYSGIAIPKPQNLTPTRMQKLLDCPLRYYLEYECELYNEEEDEEFIFGRAFHDAVEAVLNNGKPANWEEYYEKVMRELLKNRNKEERFEILSKRADGVKWFCKKDFSILKEEEAIISENDAKGKKRLDEFCLEARPDRLGSRYVIDYKTGSPKDGDRLQALFYVYLFDQEPLFYYLKEKKIKTAKDFEIKDPKKELEELLQQLEFTTRYAVEAKSCQWCDYRFICHKEMKSERR